MFQFISEALIRPASGRLLQALDLRSSGDVITVFSRVNNTGGKKTNHKTEGVRRRTEPLPENSLEKGFYGKI